MKKINDGFYSCLKNRYKKDKKDLLLDFGGVISSGMISLAAFAAPIYGIVQILQSSMDEKAPALFVMAHFVLFGIVAGLKFGKIGLEFLEEGLDDLFNVLEDKQDIKQYKFEMKKKNIPKKD